LAHRKAYYEQILRPKLSEENRAKMDKQWAKKQVPGGEGETTRTETDKESLERIRDAHNKKLELQREISKLEASGSKGVAGILLERFFKKVKEMPKNAIKLMWNAFKKSIIPAIIIGGGLVLGGPGSLMLTLPGMILGRKASDLAVKGINNIKESSAAMVDAHKQEVAKNIAALNQELKELE
jgi:hypothetical protein